MAETEFEYVSYEDGIAITDYNGTGGEVVIPTEIDGKKVLYIKSGFRERTDITKLYISEGVERLGLSVFMGMTSLSEIHLPNTLESIGTHAFAKCSSLKTLHIPELVNTMEPIIPYTSSLEQITVDENNEFLESTGDILYYKPHNRIIGYACGSSTERLVIPAHTERIGFDAFRGSVNIKTVVTNKGLVSIQSEAFCDCPALKEIYVVDSATEIHGYATRKPVVVYSNGSVVDIAQFDLKPYVDDMEDLKHSEVKLGDADGDGLVTAVDARVVLQHVAEITLINDEKLKDVDMNDDDIVSAIDARMILRQVAGLE